MKIVLKRIILLAIIAFSCFALATATYKSADVSAAVAGSNVYSDSFDPADGSGLSADWVSFGGATFKQDYSAMRFYSDKYDWHSHVVNGAYKLVYKKAGMNSCTVDFTINRISGESGWFAMSYGSENVSDVLPHASGAIIFYSSSTGVMGQSEGALDDGTLDRDDDFKVFNDKNVRVSVKFSKVQNEENYYDLSMKCYDADTQELLSQSKSWKVWIKDGYFGFKTCTMRADVFDFAVYENDNFEEAVFEDDFSQSVVSYTNSVSGQGEPIWYASKFWDETNLIVGKIGRLDISQAGSGVVYKYPVENADANGLNVLYTLSAEFYVDEMINADSGFIIGADVSGEGGTLIGVRKTAEEEFKVLFRTGDNETLYPLNLSAQSVSITVKVYYDKTAEVIIGGNTYYFELDSVGDYLGFKTYGDLGSKGAYVDNFSYDGNEYVDRASPDAKVNFQDTKDGKYYYSTKYWYAGPQMHIMSLPPSAEPESYMIFQDANEFSCFTPKTKYNDFIVRFDITFDAVRYGSTVGIEVGKNKVDESASNSIYVGFRHGQLEHKDATYYVGYKCETAEGGDNGVIYSPLGNPENIFVTGETYTFMAIVNNGTISLFIKNVNEDDSVLAYERARFVNVPTDGYMSMFASEADVSLDNFSVINLDYEYFSDDYDGNENLQTFRYDFTTGTDFSAVELGTVNKDKTVKVIRERDVLSTVGTVGANITRIRFADIEAGAVYKHGNLDVSIYTPNDKISTGRIIVSNGNDEKIVPLGSDFVYAGAMLQIEERLGNVILSFVSGDKPLAAITNNVYEFKINNDLTAEKIYISSPYIASIKEFSVFNLDTNVSIDSKEYVQQNVRTVKTAIQDGGGCSDAIGGDSYALLALTALAGVVLMIKRRQRNV